MMFPSLSTNLSCTSGICRKDFVVSAAPTRVVEKTSSGSGIEETLILISFLVAVSSVKCEFEGESCCMSRAWKSRAFCRSKE
jgi:hypothetical protein